jgi:hypothetical protein
MDPIFNTSMMRTLTAALGGRPLYAFLWVLWFLYGFLIVLIRDTNRTSSSLTAIIVCGAAGLLYSYFLIRSLIAKKRIMWLIAVRHDLQTPRSFFKLLIWITPFMIVGAVIAPAILL